jgi:hypothetical protein
MEAWEYREARMAVTLCEWESDVWQSLRSMI